MHAFLSLPTILAQGSMILDESCPGVIPGGPHCYSALTHILLSSFFLCAGILIATKPASTEMATEWLKSLAL